MNRELLLKAISGIAPPGENEITIEQFQEAAGIPSRSAARAVIEFLVSRKIGLYFSNNEIAFFPPAKLNVAVMAIEAGCDVEQVSGKITWQDFEKLASEVLNSLGYKTRTNVRFTKPRMEIDVVGISAGFALAIDCKHWKRNISSISVYSRKQAARADRLVADSKEIMHAIPVILTLYSERVQFIEGIPVVPVAQFRSFVIDVKGFLQEIRICTRLRT